jgi:anti-sigma-K factor RskA
MTDEDRIAHLMGEPAGSLDDVDEAALDDLRDLLRDPSVWAAPPADLGDRVVASIAAEAGAPPAPPVQLKERRRRRPWVAAALAAAAVVVGALLAGGMLSHRSGGTQVYVALEAVGAPGASGSATLTRTDAGWDIELDVTSLARLDNGAYYQAWLKNAAGVLVPVGTFNAGGHIDLWAGVSPIDYPAFSVTVEVADGDQASSGRRVLAGTVSAKKEK